MGPDLKRAEERTAGPGHQVQRRIANLDRQKGQAILGRSDFCRRLGHPRQSRAIDLCYHL